jgi:hypothetical protein
MKTEKLFIFHILFDVFAVGSWKMHLLFLVHLSLYYNFKNRFLLNFMYRICTKLLGQQYWVVQTKSSCIFVTVIR